MKYQKIFKIHDNPKKLYKRMRIIEDFLSGMTLTAISVKEKCTIKTVKFWVDRYKEYLEQNKEDKEFDFTSNARLRKISIPYKVQKYIIKKCSNKSTGGKDGISLNYLLSQINGCSRLRKRLKFHGKLSKTTLHRFIRDKFGKPYRLRKKPLIKSVHAIQKKNFAKYITDEKISGNDIFFTDEKIFLLDFLPNRQTNQIRLSNYMKKKLRKGDESAEKLLSIEIPKKSKGFMAAGGVSKNGVGKLIFCIGNVDSFAYKQAISYYIDDIKRLSQGEDLFFFQQDNAPSHTSKDVKMMLNDIKCLKFWPPNSPELSPIEKVWSYILRKLEGIKFNDLDAFKKKVLYIWNRVPKSYCKKIIEKFDEDINSLVNKGKITNKPKSSYGPFKLCKPQYTDEIENIIYNKKVMMENINKKKKEISKQILKKKQILHKLETKKFSNQVYEEISAKHRINKNIILSTLKEELEFYKKDIDSLIEEKKELNDTTTDNFFNKLNQKEKEKLINIYPTINLIENDNEETESESLSENIEKIINKPIERQKNKIRKDIKFIISQKISEARKKRTKKFKNVKFLSQIEFH
jgi:hypothetical protein